MPDNMTDGTHRFIENVGAIISDCVAAVFEAMEEKPDRIIHVAPGASVAWDGCGQLWGRLVRVEPAKAQGPCDITHFYAIIEIGVLRCVAVVTDNGAAPAASLVEDDGLQGLADMGAMLQGIRCSTPQSTIVRYDPLGPNGGLAGGTWQMNVRLDNCVRCPSV